MKEQFSRLLLDWYKENARTLPWRGNPDPYAVWVSEIMLQQTRVDTVLPYFDRWMRTFPDIPSLASASQDEVLNAWEGLGYYSRARSMQKAARVMVEINNGKVPGTFAQLLDLPGVGKYTAAAIASIVFGLDHAVVDGNVKRVLARVFDYKRPVNTPWGEKELQTIATGLLPPGKAGEYNQAVMDLGAMICTPRLPQCGCCPLSAICEACKHELQNTRPVLVVKAPVPHLMVTAAILHRDGHVLIAKRPANGLLGGLWEFPGGKVESGETHSQALTREIEEELGVVISVQELFGTYRHAYTHFKVTLQAYHVALGKGEPHPVEANEIRWVSIGELGAYPMGKIDRLISNDLVNSVNHE